MRVAEVDDVSSDSPSPGVDAAAGDCDFERDASDRGALFAVADGNVGTVGVGVGGVGVVTVAIGVVTVAVGVETPGFGTVTVPIGVVTAGVGFFGARLCHFAFQAASACRSWPSNPLGTARVIGPLGPGPLNPFVASDASAVARYSPAAAVAYGPP